MSTDREFIDYVIEQADLGPRLTVNKMFGEFGIYIDGIITAFACDNSLFLKASKAALPVSLDSLPQRPLFPGSKDYAVLDELLDDADTLRAMLLLSAASLPDTRKRTGKTKPR